MQPGGLQLSARDALAHRLVPSTDGHRSENIQHAGTHGGGGAGEVLIKQEKLGAGVQICCTQISLPFNCLFHEPWTEPGISSSNFCQVPDKWTTSHKTAHPFTVPTEDISCAGWRQQPRNFTGEAATMSQETASSTGWAFLPLSPYMSTSPTGLETENPQWDTGQERRAKMSASPL